VREWGRIGQPGTVRETWFETEGEAWAAGEQWRERKERRGYRAVDGIWVSSLVACRCRLDVARGRPPIYTPFALLG